MGALWSRLECEAIVDDYLDMLAAECREEPYSKTERRQRLQSRLNNRSDGSIEYKHQNISAVLIRAGRTYIRGYKPAWNYQDLLEEVVLDRILAQETSLDRAEDSLIARISEPAGVPDPTAIIVDPPDRLPERELRDLGLRTPRKPNYADREAANRKLGERGELFVYQLEKHRLTAAGRGDLASDVEWTSKERGDGTGYDLRSFAVDSGEPLFIEVKTTNSGKYQPFLISANEVRFSSENATRFALYRLFDFSRKPGLYILDGAVKDFVDLTPTMFRASF